MDVGHYYADVLAVVICSIVVDIVIRLVVGRILSIVDVVLVIKLVF